MSTEDEMRALELGEDEHGDNLIPISYATPGASTVRVPCGVCPQMGLTEDVNFHIIEAHPRDPLSTSILHGNVVRVVFSLN